MVTKCVVPTVSTGSTVRIASHRKGRVKRQKSVISQDPANAYPAHTTQWGRRVATPKPRMRRASRGVGRNLPRDGNRFKKVLHDPSGLDAFHLRFRFDEEAVGQHPGGDRFDVIRGGEIVPA